MPNIRNTLRENPKHPGHRLIATGPPRTDHDVEYRLFEKTCRRFFEVVALRCSTTKHGRDRPPATTPTEQPPRKLSGKRTVQREHLESGACAPTEGERLP